MKISGTKKLLILFLSLVVAAAAGLGVFFASAAPVSANADGDDVPELVYDEEVIRTVANELGYEYGLVNFYAHAFNLGSERLAEEVKLDRDGIVEDIQLVFADYASGELSYEGNEIIEEQDWFIAPDEVGSYALAVGLSDTWTSYVTSANRPVSNETDIYWENTNFTLGPNYRMPNEAWDYEGDINNGSSGNYAGNGAWAAGNFFMYSWVWLEEGEEYDFGIYSTRAYNNVYMGAMKADVFFEDMLTYDPDPFIIGPLSGNTIHPKNIQGYWFAKDASGTYRGQDPQQKTLAQYKQDYATDVDPTTPVTTATSTQFMKWTTRNTAANKYNQITITGDAPSGVYYFRAFRPGNLNYYRFVTDNATAISPCSTTSNAPYVWFYPHNGWSVNSDYCDYAVIVHRDTVTEPSVQVETGVNNAHTEKTVTYDSTPQSMTITNDWGEGLIMCNVTYTDAAGTSTTLMSYVPSVTDPLTGAITPSHVDTIMTPVTSGNYVTYTYNNPNGEPVTVRRGAVGRRNAAHEDLIITATDKGTYTIKLTPFNKWSDGTSSTKTYTFKIVDRYLTQPSLSADGTGVVTGNTKTVHDDGNVQYVNFYPVLQDYLDWDAYYEDGNGGYETVSTKENKLKFNNWSDDGMLTLEAAQGVQGTFKVVIYIMTPDNVKWTDGSTNEMVFYFTVAPRLLTVSPTILGTTGVDNVNRTKTLPFSGSYQTMNIMYVDGVSVTYEQDVQTTYVSEGNPDFNPKGTKLERSQSLLTLTVFDAGEYIVTLNLGKGYCWTDGGDGPREYKFTVTPKKVSAPKFDNVYNTDPQKTTVDKSNINDIRITTQYVGDTDTNGQTWTANIKFTEAYEQSISWRSPSSSQYVFNRGEWLNSTLTVTARNAGVYILEFYCKPNYEWSDEQNVPKVTLTINRKPVDTDPYILTNGDETAPLRGGTLYTYEGGKIIQMTVDCDFNQHALLMFLGDKDAIDAKYNGNVINVSWDHGDISDHDHDIYSYDSDGNPITRYSITTTKGQAVFVTKNAGTYTIELTPSSNYCWSDGTTETKIFTFKLNAQPVTPLDWMYLRENGTEWDAFSADLYKDGVFTSGEFSYRGSDTPYQFKIGPVPGKSYITDGTDPNNSYPTQGKFDTNWFGFYVVYNEKIYFENSLDDINVTAEVKDGYLYITATEAGTYKIKMLLNNTDYRWRDSNDVGGSGNNEDDEKSSITYEFTIGQSQIAKPVIDQTRSNPGGSETHDYTDTKMAAMYFNDTKVLAIAVTIGVQYTDFVQYEILDESGELEWLEPDATHPSYDTVKGTYIMYFTAKNAGTYQVRITLDSVNHKWAEDVDEYIFTLDVPRAPVIGVKAEYNSDVICDGAVGSDTVYEYALTFNEKNEQIVITRLGKGNLVDDTFETQYDVEVKGTYRSGEAIEWDYLYSYAADGDSLTLSVFHAGTYIITVTPSSNYQWYSGNDETGSVTIKLTVKPLEVGIPVIYDDSALDGSTVDNVQLVKTVEFDEINPNTMTVDLITDTDFGTAYHPDAYIVVGWDGHDITGWDGTDTSLPVLQGNKIIASAQSTGSHDMYLRLSDTNNYIWNTENDSVRYTLKITKQSIVSPTGWLVEGYGGYDDGAGGTSLNAYNMVLRAINNSGGVAGVDSIPAGRQYPATLTFDGDRHYVYLTGGAISSIISDDNPNGSIILSVVCYDANGNNVASCNGYQQYIGQDNIKITPVYIDSTGSNKTLVAYEISAINADSYYVTLKFATDDYYWKDTGINNDSSAREFVLKIKPRTVDVPVFQGQELQTLLNDTYTAEFKFDGNNQSIDIVGITDLMKYEFGSGIDNTASPDYPNKTLTMTTVGTYGYASAAEEVDYVIILYFDNPNNIVWSSGTPTKEKYFRIKINSVEITAPKIDATALAKEDELHVQFTGDVNDFKDVLTLKDISAVNKYLTPSATDTQTLYYYLTSIGDSLKNYLTVDGYTSWFQLDFLGEPNSSWQINSSGNLSISTPVYADTYTVTVNLLEPDNMVWKGKTDDSGNALRTALQFKLIIDPMPVDIPAIDGTAADGVIGLSKTVKYNGSAQQISVMNFWADNPSDWNNSENLWMNIETEGTPWVDGYTPASGSFDLTFVSYVPNTYASGSSNTSYTGYAANPTKYDAINKGKLTFSATDAGTYIVRYVLTDNAVWNDPVYANVKTIEVKFVIEKEQFATPAIDGTGISAATVTGNTITYTYALDANYDPIERMMYITNYNLDTTDYMALVTPFVETDGNGNSVTGNVTDGGYLSNVYTFKATNAGTYEITFKLTDFNNRCWKEGVNVETITFTFKINKQTLAAPVQSTSYNLTNETVNVENNTLTVEYDDKAHSMLVQFIVEDNNVTGNLANAANSHYLYFADTTSATDNNDTLIIDYYADTNTNGLTTNDLFDLSGTKHDGVTPFNYVYAGPSAGQNVDMQNIVVLKAFGTGVYEFTVSLADPDNMQWGDGTITDKTFTLTINKKVHDVPSIPSDSSSQQYTGEWIDFTIYDVYNEYNSKSEWDSANPSGTNYEGYQVISYEGKGISYDALANPSDATAIANLYQQSSWYDGNLILQFREVGTYKVKVTILLPDEVSWRDTTDTEVILTIVVLPRELSAKFTFEAPNDEKVNALLLQGSNEWPLSTEVKATLTLSNLVPDASVGGVVPEDTGLQIEITSTDTVFSTITLSTIVWADMKTASDGTWEVTYVFNMPYNPNDAVVRGTYTLKVSQLDDPDLGGSNYKILTETSTQNYKITPDPAPFDDSKIVWQYENSNHPNDWTNASAGLDANNRLPLWYLTDGGHWTVQMTIDGYSTLSDGLADGKVMIDHVTGDVSAQNAGNYSYTIYLTSVDPDLWYFPTTAYTLYYTIEPALYDLSGISWAYGSDTPYIYDGTQYFVYVTGLPAGLTDASYSVVSYDFNRQTNAGEYETSVIFVSSSRNYVVPVFMDTTTYSGTFDWTFKWTIEKQNISIGWAEGSYDSDGSVLTYNPVVDSHQEKFAYRYYKLAVDSETGCTLQQDADGNWIYADASGIEYYLGRYVINGTDVYIQVSSVSGGTNNTFYVEAYLTSAYENNYTFDFSGAPDFSPNGNFKEFVFVDGTVIYNHITIDGKTQPNGEYEYQGYNLYAEVVVDLDTTGGALDNGTIDILYFYYRQNLDASGNAILDANGNPEYDDSNPLTDAPYDIGKYVFVAKLLIRNGSTTYTLSEDTYYYEIIKQQLSLDDFVWQYTHINSDGETIVAEYDELNGVWKNVDTGESVDFVYDGNVHSISLVSKNVNVRPMASQGSDYINASSVDSTTGAYINYVAEFTFIYDELRYEFPADALNHFASYKALIDDSGAPVLDSDNNPVSVYIWSIEWVVEKQKLDLTLTDWDYSGDYVFTVVGGKPVFYSVELKNLPEYLKDKVVYVTKLDNSSATTVDNSLSNAGKYYTVATINADPDSDDCLIDFDNYVIIGNSALSIAYTLQWEISTRLLDVPQRQAEYDWTNFDGNYHNLFAVLGIQTDWAEYFSFVVNYQESEASTPILYWNSTNSNAINMYTAYNAGIYSFVFTVNSALNALNEYGFTNVAWNVASNGADATTEDQEVTLKVEKAVIQVVGWNDNYESSTVILGGTGYGSKFIEYEFYYDNAGSVGTSATLDNVLDSNGGDTFYIHPIISDKYVASVDITFVNTDEYYKFVTRNLSDIDNALPVGVKPYIVGYTDSDGIYHSYTADEITAFKNGTAIPTVIYTGGAITFNIYNWNYYESLVTFWNSDVSDLKQTDVGEYSVTLVLKTEDDVYYYWRNEDGTEDRKSVVLKFNIEYLRIPLPVTDNTDNVYTSDVIDILKVLMGEGECDDWFAKYGDYFEVSGTRLAVNVGTYELYLSIKDEDSVSVRWYDGTQDYAGTYTLIWNIDPVKIKIPTLVTQFPEYDGEVHEVYDVFSSYGDEAMTLLKDYVNLYSGGQGKNAGDYQAVFTLPDKNFVWVDDNGNVLDALNKTGITVSGSTLTVDWKIEKAQIDFSKAVWGYVDDNGGVHEYTQAFEYAIKNGQPYIYRVQLVILDDGTLDDEAKAKLDYLNDLLVNCVSYRTDNFAGNGAYKVAQHTTSYSLDKTRFDANNYNVIWPNDLGNLDWEIVKKEFPLDPDTTGWTFDGDVHEFMQVLGYGEDWANYFEIVKVEYRGENDVNYSAYNGKNLEIVGFSLYKGFYVGSYRIEFKLKDSVPKDSVSWAYTGSILAEFNCTKYELEIEDWNYDGESSPTISNDIDQELFDRMFYYVIYEDGDSSMTPISYDDVQEGVAYCIELRVKDECKDGVSVSGSYFYTFGEYNYNDPMRWMPLPQLTLSGDGSFTADVEITFEYNGSKQVVKLTETDGVYEISSSDAAKLRGYGVKLSADDTHFVYIMGGNDVLTQSAAGEYSVVVRLLSKVNLSWYDPDTYYVRTDADGNDVLYYISNDQPVSSDDLETLFDRSARTLKFTITPKGYEPIDMSGIGDIPDLVYNGEKQDITKSEELKDWFDALKALYGDAIKIEGYEETDVPEDKYTVKISLSDAKSSYWYLTLDENNSALGFTLDVNGKFVDDNGDEFNDGNYIVKVLEDGTTIITFVDMEYTFDWTITPKGLTAPYVDEDINYTGKDIKVSDYNVVNYYSDDMKFTAGETGKAVGTYTATVEITSRNYVWITVEEDEDGNEQTTVLTDKSITFNWEIQPANIELNGIVWKISGNGESYTFVWDDDNSEWVAQNGYPVYTRVNGQAVVYKVELDGLPEVLQGHVVYTTNGVKAHAGSSAGKYTTSVTISDTDSFAGFEAPEWLETAFEWQIEQRVLDKPAYEGSLLFDDEVHDLLEMLNIDRNGDWKEYYTINIWYSEEGSSTEVKYGGYGGDAYLIYGTGTYRIEVKLIDGINSKYVNVVWQA